MAAQFRAARSKVGFASSTSDLGPTAIARNIIRAARAADLKLEPIVRSSPIGQAYSLIQSTVCRHGSAIQQMLADGIAQDERFEIMRDHSVPVCVAALECVSSRTRPEVLKMMTLSASGAVHHIASVDLLAVNLRRGWAGVFDCKRGHSQTPSKQRRSIELDLKAMQMVLPSFVRQLGFLQVDIATGGVIDFYGNAGFRDELTISRESVDHLFEMPLIGKVEKMTAALERELCKTVNEILGIPAGAPARAAEIRQVNEKVVSLFRRRPPSAVTRDDSSDLGGD